MQGFEFRFGNGSSGLLVLAPPGEKLPAIFLSRDFMSDPNRETTTKVVGQPYVRNPDGNLGSGQLTTNTSFCLGVSLRNHDLLLDEDLHSI